MQRQTRALVMFPVFCNSWVHFWCVTRGWCCLACWCSLPCSTHTHHHISTIYIPKMAPQSGKSNTEGNTEEPVAGFQVQYAGNWNQGRKALNQHGWFHQSLTRVDCKHPFLNPRLSIKLCKVGINNKLTLPCWKSLPLQSPPNPSLASPLISVHFHSSSCPV